MRAEKNIANFKLQLLRVMPFYGDILTQIPIVPEPAAGTARTNGRRIEYSPAYFSTLKPGEQNYVLMHELFHILLSHCDRIKGRDPQLWNTATDLIVNDMLDSLRMPKDIPFSQPEGVLHARIYPGETAESVYGRLLGLNARQKQTDPVIIESGKDGVQAPSDLLPAPEDGPAEGEADPSEAGGAPADAGPGEQSGGDKEKQPLNVSQQAPGQAPALSREEIERIIRTSLEKNRSELGSYFVPRQIYSFAAESKLLPWKSLLRDFMEEKESEDSSYATPERKYLHMDLILPGHCRGEEELEEVWAFVDCSGSISKEEMEQFLTQLYRIVKEFGSRLNLCYWDTKVEEVYRNIRDPDDILKHPPRHSGGTNINCVYEWLRDNRVDPGVMLVLTDGYFGVLREDLFRRSLQRKTILVLSSGVPKSDPYKIKRMGKLACLND